MSRGLPVVWVCCQLFVAVWLMAGSAQLRCAHFQPGFGMPRLAPAALLPYLAHTLPPSDAAGCKEAIRVMRDQPSGGHIFNMDGAGGRLFLFAIFDR